MTRKEEAFFAMGLKVRNFYTSHTAEMTAVPAVAAYYAQLNTLLNALIDADAGARANIKGYTLAKAAKRQRLEGLALQLSAALGAYATVHEDRALKIQAYFTPNRWRYCSEEVLITKASVMRNLAQALPDNLLSFGVEPNAIAKLDTALADFVAVIHTPSAAIAQRKADNERLDACLGAIRQLLNEKLDVLMRSFEAQSPWLYRLYKSARTIDNNVTARQATEVQKPVTKKRQTSATRTKAKTEPAAVSSEAIEVVSELSQTTSPLVNINTDIALNSESPSSQLAEGASPSGLRLMLKSIGARLSKVRLWGD